MGCDSAVDRIDANAGGRQIALMFQIATPLRNNQSLIEPRGILLVRGSSACPQSRPSR